MTPKEKANQLVAEFISEGCLFASATKCAIICVDEILNIYDLEGYEDLDPKMSYYKKVKEEIQNI